MSKAETPPKAAVFGCAGTEVSGAERTFYRAADPLGFILFRRNCEDPTQVKRLVADLRGSVSRADAPVLIDQEGGRVVRLGPPHWRKPPAPAVFGALYELDPVGACAAAHLNARLMAHDLAALGIDIDCVPVLDVAVPGMSEVVGDRALSGDIEAVAALGRAVCEGMLAGGVLPVIKHLPGHGRARVDSHKALPEVDAELDELEALDFAPFRALCDMPLGISAHVCYRALDAQHPGTLSAEVITHAIRGAIGFEGLLFTDDLSMGALEGTVGQRAARAIAAGCDIALHCNGEMAEMEDVAASTGPMTNAAAARWARAGKMRGEPERDFDAVAGLNELERLLGA